jgi:hypothetical protein
VKTDLSATIKQARPLPPPLPSDLPAKRDKSAAKKVGGCTCD